MDSTAVPGSTTGIEQQILSHSWLPWAVILAGLILGAMLLIQVRATLWKLLLESMAQMERQRVDNLRLTRELCEAKTWAGVQHAPSVPQAPGPSWDDLMRGDEDEEEANRI